MYGIVPEDNKIKKPVLQAVKLFKKNGSYNIVQLKAHLMDEGLITQQHMNELIDKFQMHLEHEPNLHEVDGSVVIIGDIHGQYYDFLKILSLVPEIDNEQKPTKLIFLGDYVDRGANSIEVMTLIMALKVNYPKKVILLRGNHESRCMTSLYNFMTETLSKYGQQIYQKFMLAFDALPLACLVNSKFFCVHGGITDKLLEIKKINTIERYVEIPLEGPFCDFIWSDPVSNDFGSMGCQTKFNESRQCSIYFGKQLTQKFLTENEVIGIIRAHEVFPEGFRKYSWKSKGKSQEFPDVITVFSAPNYCGVYGNRGAIIKLENQSFQIRQYKEESVNNKLYDYLEVFHWSVPEIVRVLNQFSISMISSLYQIYLKKDFPDLSKKDDATKLQLLLGYIKERDDLDANKPIENVTASQKQSTMNKDKEDENEKQRLFNRSVEYMQRGDQRPISGEFFSSKVKEEEKMAKSELVKMKKDD